jgi:hypothetical protein
MNVRKKSPCIQCIRCHKLLIIAKNTTAINKLHYTRSSYKINGFVIVEAGGKKRKKAKGKASGGALQVSEGWEDVEKELKVSIVICKCNIMVKHFGRDFS